MKAKNASFSSVLASSSTGNLVAADSCLEDSGLLLRSLWVPELEPKMFSVGQRGTKRNRVELGSALDPPPPALPYSSPWGNNFICVGHTCTGPCLYIPHVNLGSLLKVDTVTLCPLYR